MEEFIEFLVRIIIKPILWVLRILQFLAYDLLVERIGWFFGWVFLRIVTFGYVPKESLKDIDNVHWSKALAIEIFGLFVLAGLVLLVESAAKY